MSKKYERVLKEYTSFKHNKMIDEFTYDTREQAQRAANNAEGLCCREFTILAGLYARKLANDPRNGAGTLDMFRETRTDVMCKTRPVEIMTAVENSEGQLVGFHWEQNKFKFIEMGDIIWFVSKTVNGRGDISTNWNAHVSLATGSMARDGHRSPMILNFGAGKYMERDDTGFGADQVSHQSIEAVVEHQASVLRKYVMERLAPDAGNDAIARARFDSTVQLFNVVYYCKPKW